MKLYRIAQAKNITIDKEDMIDRARYRLKDNGKEIGYLCIQSNIHPKYFMLEQFKIDPAYQGQHLGTKLMNEALNDSRWKSKPIIVSPMPYKDAGPIGGPAYAKQVEDLASMYRHFGFVDFPDWQGWLILDRTGKPTEQK